MSEPNEKSVSGCKREVTFRLRGRRNRIIFDRISFLQHRVSVLVTVDAEQLGRFRVIRPRFVRGDTYDD